MKITVTREKRLHGAVVPYFLIVGYDVERFKEIVEIVKAAKSEDELTNYLKEMEGVKQYAINNGETMDIAFESDNNEMTIFATNGFLNNDPIHPLSISNMLTCADGDSITLKSTGGWLKGAKLLLEMDSEG